MAEPGRVGGGVVAVGDASPVVIESKLAHGLFDGDRVRITSPGATDRPLLVYVKSTGYGANSFAVFSNSALKQPAQLNGSVAPDATIDCFAQTDRAIVVGINIYPAFTSLKGPTKDASEFAAWVKSGIGGCVPDDHVKLIQSPPYETPPTIEDVEPTLLKVAKAFQDLANMANRADDHYLGRRLYIFMSGHGILPDPIGNSQFRRNGSIDGEFSKWKLYDAHRRSESCGIFSRRRRVRRGGSIYGLLPRLHG